MAKLTVLGVGNILMRDEGIGVRVLERVQRARSWPADVEFIDGGAGGLNLLTVIERAERLVVFDAAEMHLKPGEFRVVLPEQVADESAGGRLSLHQMPFIETLGLCRQFSRAPGFVRILAIQPRTVEYGRELSEEIGKALPDLVKAGEELILKSLE